MREYRGWHSHLENSFLCVYWLRNFIESFWNLLPYKLGNGETAVKCFIESECSPSPRRNFWSMPRKWNCSVKNGLEIYFFLVDLEQQKECRGPSRRISNQFRKLGAVKYWREPPLCANLVWRIYRGNFPKNFNMSGTFMYPKNKQNVFHLVRLESTLNSSIYGWNSPTKRNSKIISELIEKLTAKSNSQLMEKQFIKG